MREFEIYTVLFIGGFIASFDYWATVFWGFYAPSENLLWIQVFIFLDDSILYYKPYVGVIGYGLYKVLAFIAYIILRTPEHIEPFSYDVLN